MANEPKNLYNYKDFFRLTIGGAVYYIDEPIGWDAVNIKGERDKEYFGFNYEFVDPELPLKFPARHGFELIEAEYAIRGGDGYAVFEYGYEIPDTGTKKVQFKGTLNFNTRKQLDDEVEITIEKTQFNQLLRTRIDTKVAMNATQDLDGGQVLPPTPLQLRLHSKKIVKQSIGGQATDLLNPSVETTGHGQILILPDTMNPVQTELDTLFNMPFGIGYEGGVLDNLYNLDLYQFKAEEPGISTIEFKAAFTFIIASKTVNIGTFSLVTYLVVRRAGVNVLFKNQVVASGTIAGKSHSVAVNFTMTEKQFIQKDDVIYLFYKYSNDSSTYKLNFLGYTNTISIKSETVAPASNCYGYKLIDCFRHVVKCLTGKDDVVIAPFFDIGGGAEKYIITNGFQIRNFEIDKRPVQISLMELLQGCGPLWNIGYQYTETPAGADAIFYAPFEDLFGTEIITELKEIYDYEELHSKDTTFNEIIIGFEKFAEDEINTLDEFNTTATFLTPIKTYKAKYEKRSKFIASGYSIESIRREQFKANPSSSFTNDDALFIISYVEGQRVYDDVSFSLVNASPANFGIATFNKTLGLTVGEKFTIASNGANAGTLFTVVSVGSTLNESYLISPNPVNEAGAGVVSVPISYPSAERNEAFSVVENLISPETAYNLRLSPKHTVLNHAAYLNAGLAKKEDTDLIKNTYFKNNGELVTQFKLSEPHPLAAGYDRLKEIDAIAIKEFDKRRAKYSGEIATFKAPLTYDVIFLIRQSLTRRNHSNPGKNFGLIIHPDQGGNRWKSVIESFEYEPVKEILTLTVRKVKKV